MRRAPWLFIPSILLVLGCTRPEVEAFRRQPAPVSVSVSLPSGLADHEAFQKEYASALRARLATRVVVVPEGVKPPVGAAQLQVVIRDLSPAPGQPSPTAVGVATGVTVGAISAASGNRGWGIVDGLFWGLWAGSHAAMHRERVQDRLGYLPTVVRAQVSLVQPGNPEPLWVESIEPVEVVEAMDPLPRGYRDDDGRIREEEAKGFARVVVQKLTAYFQWTRFTEQRFYEDPSGRKEGASQPRRVDPPAPPIALPPTAAPTEPPPPPPATLPPPPGSTPEPPAEPKQN
ncbi:MAG: hypothetical protein HXX12_15845 [Geothrix sp.]|uniref:hypothetical protein n=1 Tax=Geothrix sp. TaxID=1962974 RepID=UPI0017B3AFDF|nr:hypothetical protein [Geothrix sp.]NWJ42433.1 hypothetical protein [Geothrix sp.]WIL19603.1 MAG: hypothetical protein QOZ81_002126 [Geothrix sp.]